jgi:hypothetical protein
MQKRLILLMLRRPVFNYADGPVNLKFLPADLWKHSENYWK